MITTHEVAAPQVPSNFDLSVCYTNVGRGLAPAVSLNLKGFHGESKPPPYIVDYSLNYDLSLSKKGLFLGFRNSP